MPMTAHAKGTEYQQPSKYVILRNFTVFSYVIATRKRNTTIFRHAGTVIPAYGISGSIDKKTDDYSLIN